MNWLLFIIAAEVASLTPAFTEAQNHPFGSHPMPYTAGAILPNHFTPAARDQAVRDFYDAWKAEYLVQDCGTGRYIVEAKTMPGNLTVSEGHGYGMIIAALMAGYDPAAQVVFDGMYAYFREHPTATHSYLMSWNQNRSCEDVEGNDSASDGDLDIAFALLLADKQWGSCGAVDYHAEALQVIADIKDGELDPPVCTAGSARGLSKLKYRPRSDHDFDFEARARRSTIAVPVGPLRATLVLGDDIAAGNTGACAISASVPCSGTSSALRCR